MHHLSHLPSGTIGNKVAGTKTHETKSKSITAMYLIFNNSNKITNFVNSIGIICFIKKAINKLLNGRNDLKLYQ